MRDRRRTFGVTTNMTARITVRNDPELAFANLHRLVIVADFKEISGHHIQGRAGIENIAVRVNDRARRRITFEAFEIADRAQDFRVAIDARAFAFGPGHLVDQLLPARIINQSRTWILADDVRHRRPVKVILDTELENVPSVVDSLRENHRVDNEVELQLVFAAILFGQFYVLLDAIRLSAIAKIDQIIATGIIRRIQANDEIVNVVQGRQMPVEKKGIRVEGDRTEIKAANVLEDLFDVAAHGWFAPGNIQARRSAPQSLHRFNC